MALVHEHRLFPSDADARAIAVRLYAGIRDLPILSPHGHTQASWFARNEPFANPVSLLIQPDHYIFRMLYSQGIALETLGVGTPVQPEPREVWRLFAENYFLFRGTPTRLWLDTTFEEVFGLEIPLNLQTADRYYDTIATKLATPEFLPRALFARFRIEVLATTDAATDSLRDHAALRASGWEGRVLPTFRPDTVVDPDTPGFSEHIATLGSLAGEDSASWSGYLAALRHARMRFKAMGATASDHGHPTAATADLPQGKAAALFGKVLSGRTSAHERELFRAQMLTESARMSLEDGLVMQLHPGSLRNHNPELLARFGRDMGADIPTPTNYVQALRPLLQAVGNDRRLTLILFTLDESTYSRELAPLAGHYPCLRLGPPWWFHDSPEGMMRYRQQVTETAGFYNTVGFNDDTRAFLSIPARHDVARRADCAFLSRLVAEHRMTEAEAAETARDLTINLVRRAYRL